jgi:uncharacterized protein YegL
MAQDAIQLDDLAGFTAMKRREQLGILVLDGSGSMKEPGLSGQSKGLEVQTAVRDLISRLQASTRASEFYLAIVTYCNVVNENRLPPAEVEKCDPLGNYDPVNGHGGMTAIGDALESAHQVAETFLAKQDQYPRQAVVVLMTDGGQNHGSDPRSVAQKIKANNRLSLAACAFGKDADDTLMKELASSLDMYLHAYKIDQLRAFFLASLTGAGANSSAAAT